MSLHAEERPGFSIQRMADLSLDAVHRMALELHGVRVLTEAATGAYSVTSILAALAGAEVIALTKDSRYGSVDEVTDAIGALARHLGVGPCITVVPERRPEHFAWADLVTNSGHVRPITGEFAEAIRPGAALSLMFESWEVQAGREDLLLDYLKVKGVRIAGTNERHPHVDVFSYLGPMAVAQLADAGIPAYRSRIAVACNNPFRNYLVEGLHRVGADVLIADDFEALDTSKIDALLVAITPTGQSVLSAEVLTRLDQTNEPAVIIQFWGDIDREILSGTRVKIWPTRPPAVGHMGVLPSRLGPDAIVNLQAGGLKVGQVLLKDPGSRTASDMEYVDELA